MRTLSLSVIVVVLSLFSGTLPLVLAQDGDPNLDAQVEYQFGQELSLLLNVENAADVDQITLSLRPEFSTEIYIVDVPFDPSDTISITYPIDVERIKLKPYSNLNYSLKLDVDGDTISFPEQSVLYEDDQFGWMSSSRDGVTVHWTGNGPSFGHDVLNVVDKAVEDLSTVLPLEFIVPIDVYVYPSSAELRNAIDSIGLNSKETSHPELGVVFVTSVNPQSAVSDLGQSLPYEMAQLLLFQIGGENAKYPWWLQEGISSLFQVKGNPNYEEVIADAAEAGDTIPLWQLCQSPEESGLNPLLASAQSTSTVQYIRNRHGDQKLAGLVEKYAEGHDCQSGVKETLGIDLDKLENEWQSAYQTPSYLKEFLTSYGIWILLLGAGFVLMLLIIQFSNRGRR